MQQQRQQKPRRRGVKIAVAICIVGLLLAGSLAFISYQSHKKQPQSSAHSNITTTVFWVGEAADESNANIPNASSTWVENWLDAFGGVDDPNNRCNMLPCGFTPKENAFYFALPYNDLDTSCNTKPSQADVPWYAGAPGQGESIVKNRWIKVRYNNKTAYAQWEDAGPLGEDDTAYVFGDAAPHYKKSGLDLSPATAKYLDLDGEGKTFWEFVDEKNVPEGPWRQTVTISSPDCAG